MALSSMTGFARASGALDGLHWQWEAKSVNGKGLETRCRLATGFEHLEAAARESVARRFKRGNLQISLTCDHGSSDEVFRVNEVALEQLLAISEKLRARLGGEAPRLDGLLGLRGVIEVISTPVEPDVAARRDRALLESLDGALTQLGAMRADEGARLAAVIGGQLDRIAALTVAARDCPARRPEAFKARLAEQVGRLLEAHSGFRRDAPASRGGIDRNARRHPGGDRPVVRACRGGARASGRERAGRAEIRIPRAGVQPRGQYLVLEGDRSTVSRPSASTSRR